MASQDSWDSVDISSAPNSLLILIADSSAFVRAQIKAALRNEPVRVVEAADGEEAWRIYTSMAINLVLCDLNMPCLDGIGFLERLHERNNAKKERPVPIAILSGESRLDKVLQVKKLGALAWLQKPLVAEQLLELIPMDKDWLPQRKAS